MLLLLWEASAARGWIVSDNWPRFSSVLVAAWVGLWSGELAQILGSTLYRMLAGYAAGCALGVLFGVLLGNIRLLDWLIRPLLEIQRTLPSPAIIPPLILFLGVDDTLKIVIIMLAVFQPVFVNTYGGVRGLDETMLMTARTLSLNRFDTLRKIVLPASLPAIAAGMRIALSLALIMAVIGEMISGSSGVGNYLMTMQYAMRADSMYAAVICLAAAGYIMNRIFLVVESAALHWHHSARAE
ncbi:ABC transporter permease [Rhodopseudomonas sp. BAL398]|uniref:ABC transporter permease n=1 Tax=Rhodopseudomonas sp. BAL398 TaxID=3034676 RepID=UPI0005C80784|nr:ABC transporter permease [Rhodopseudomonas sp. BAL398]MDF3809747.1 ABC transporter permease [Rhodopseudomonas sp. BAL398]